MTPEEENARLKALLIQCQETLQVLRSTCWGIDAIMSQCATDLTALSEKYKETNAAD